MSTPSDQVCAWRTRAASGIPLMRTWRSQVRVAVERCAMYVVWMSLAALIAFAVILGVLLAAAALSSRREAHR
jgi:hypothetical protein